MEKKSSDLEIEDAGISRITDETTQIAIRIPAEIRDRFRINTNEDGINWKVVKDKETMSLHASLVKGAFKNEKKNNKSKNK